MRRRAKEKSDKTRSLADVRKKLSGKPHPEPRKTQIPWLSGNSTHFWRHLSYEPILYNLRCRILCRNRTPNQVISRYRTATRQCRKGLKISLACPTIQAVLRLSSLRPDNPVVVSLHKRPHSLSENIADGSSSLCTSSLSSSSSSSSSNA
jgi:hypothetical protein